MYTTEDYATAQHTAVCYQQNIVVNTLSLAAFQVSASVHMYIFVLFLYCFLSQPFVLYLYVSQYTSTAPVVSIHLGSECQYFGSEVANLALKHKYFLETRDQTEMQSETKSLCPTTQQ